MKAVIALSIWLVGMSASLFSVAQAVDPIVDDRGAGLPESIIRQRLAASFPLKELKLVKPVANGQLYYVEFVSGLALYALASGEYLLSGSLYQTTESGYINLSEQAKQLLRAEQLAALQSNEFLSLVPAEVPATALVYVFVDIDCYYCQLQHAEAPALMAAGVEIRYLAFNRQKPGSSAYNKVKRTWCSDKPQEALDMMMKGRSLSASHCTQGLMEKHTQLAESMDVKRLPAVVTVDGRLVSGLLRAPQLLNLLGVEVPVEDEAAAQASTSPEVEHPSESALLSSPAQ